MMNRWICDNCGTVFDPDEKNLVGIEDAETGQHITDEGKLCDRCIHQLDDIN